MSGSLLDFFFAEADPRSSRSQRKARQPDTLDRGR